MKIMNRPYKLRQRAEAQAETRRRIVDATVALHQEKGIAATSVTDIAARAGVGKVTVYRHFPDELALVGACSSQYFTQHPFPDPEAWRAELDPITRLRLGLRETYAYHRETAPMIARVLPEVRDAPLMRPYHEHWRRAAGVLAEAWPASSRDDALRAALALALSFDAWRLLTAEQGLTDAQAVDLAARLAG
jgi:AcrR family transcriptional regulator